MIRIAICDDEKHCRNRVREYCDTFCVETAIEYKIYEYETGEELLESKTPDILLLDVEMNGIDGLMVKEILGRQKTDIRILFISSHEEAIPEAFGWQVYGFLKKPLEYEQFARKMQIVVADVQEQERCVLCKNMGNIRKILVKKIRHVQANGKYTKLFLADEEEYVFSDKSISSWKEELGTDDFGACHRSYLVNFCYVKRIQQDIVLAGDIHIPLSRRMEKQFRENYREYIWRKAK